MRLRIGCVIAALVVALGGTSAGASASPVGGSIAFARNDPPGVYVVRPDGSDMRALIRLPAPRAQFSSLAWSPDGKRLASLYWQAGWKEPDIVITPATGPSTRVRLDDTLRAPASLTWSPDGRRLAFTAYAAGDRDIWVVNADGTGLRRLARTRDLVETDVAWAPRGGRIAFSAGGYVPAVYVTDVEPWNARLLVRGAVEPAWSPDGQRLVITRWRGSSASTELWSLAADGSVVRRLTRNTVADRNATWSPDGRRIAFVSAVPGGPNEVWVMQADGGGRTRLIQGGNPAWQPAGA